MHNFVDGGETMTKLKKRGNARYWLFPHEKREELHITDETDIKAVWGKNSVTLSWGHFQEIKKQKTRQLDLDEILLLIGNKKILKSSLAMEYCKQYRGMDKKIKQRELDYGLKILLEKNLIQTDPTQWYFWKTPEIAFA